MAAVRTAEASSQSTTKRAASRKTLNIMLLVILASLSSQGQFVSQVPSYRNSQLPLFQIKKEGKIIMLAANTSENTQTFQLTEENQYLQYTLAPQSAVTFVWNK